MLATLQTLTTREQRTQLMHETYLFQDQQVKANRVQEYILLSSKNKEKHTCTLRHIDRGYPAFPDLVANVQ